MSDDESDTSNSLLLYSAENIQQARGTNELLESRNNRWKTELNQDYGSLIFKSSEADTPSEMSDQRYTSSVIVEARYSEEKISSNHFKDLLRQKNEQSEAEKAEHKRTKTYQGFVLFVSSLKYFVISITQVQDQSYTISNDYTNAQVTVCFSLLLFGSIFDNTKEHRKITVVVEGIIVCMLTLYAIFQLCLIKVLNFEISAQEMKDLEFKFQMSVTIFGPAITLLIYLQLFNWFSKKAVTVVFGYLYALKAVAYLAAIWLADLGIIWQKFAGCAALMMLAAILDIVWFKYYPMEAGIFVDLEGRTNQDKQQIEQVQTYMFNNPDQKLTFFELFYREKDAGNKRVSLMQPFYYSATFILIISATMRHVSFICNLQFTNLLTHQLEFDNPETKYRVWFIAGAGISAILSSLIFTFVFRRQLALTILVFQSFNIVFQMNQIVIDYTAPEFGTETNPVVPIYLIMFFLGVIDGLSHLFLALVGPLIVAAKYRSSYEITMGGTIIAVCITFPFILGSQISPIIVYYGQPLNEHAQRIIICVVFFIGVAPFLVDAYHEFKSLKITCCNQENKRDGSRSNRQTNRASSNFSETSKVSINSVFKSN